MANEGNDEGEGPECEGLWIYNGEEVRQGHYITINICKQGRQARDTTCCRDMRDEGRVFHEKRTHLERL